MSAVPFGRLEDLPLDVIGQAIRRVPAKRVVALGEEVTQHMRKRKRG